MPRIASQVGSKHTVYVGIDPGKEGGIAVLNRGQVTAVSLANLTDRDIWEHICLAGKTEGAEPFAVLERVGGFIRVKGAGVGTGPAMFNFGRGFGLLQMALIAANIPHEIVIPRTWQKAFGITPKKENETKSQFKNRLKTVAQRLFPKEKVTLATCDAILISEFCRRMRENDK